MQILARYENFPHFCFTCGRIGHAAFNCEQEESEEQAVRYGEELRASLSKRVREINIRQPDVKAVKYLFQTALYEADAPGAGLGKYRWSATPKAKECVGDSEGQLHAGQT
jgi:hypothetical protein